MKSKKWIIVTMLVFTMIVMSACGNSSGNAKSRNNDGEANGKETIEFWTMQLKPTFTDYINGIISDFEKKNPNIHVKWVDIPWGDMEKKILTAVSSKTAPDVANLNPQFAAKLAQLGALVNMDQALTKEQKSRYLEGAWKSNTFDGKTFGVPWYLSTKVTMYNSDIFKKAGLDPKKPPKTFDQLENISKTIKQKTVKYAFFPALDGSHLLEIMKEMGVKLTNKDGTKAAFNTPEGVHVFQYFTDLYKNDLIPRDVLTEGHRKAIDMYQAGEIAIFPSGPQFLDQIKKNAPDIYKATKTSEQITGKSGLRNIAAMNLVVPKQTKHQKAAVRFALYMTNAKNQLAFSKLTAILPSVKTALDDPYFSKLPKDPKPKDIARIVSAKQLKSSEVLVPPMKNYEDLNSAMYDAISKSMLGKMSAKEAIAEAEKEWNSILSE